MSSQQFHAVTDAPIKKATFETRTAAEQARDVGALIVGALDRLNIWQHIESPLACQILTMRMCYTLGAVEDWTRGLVIRHSAKAIAASARLTPRSAYRPMRALVEAGIIRRLRPGGNRPDAYEVVMPESATSEEAQERAPTVPLAAQQARAHSAAALYSATSTDHNPLTEPVLARATARAALYSATSESADASFSTENAPAALWARASPQYSTSTPTLTFTSTAKAEEGRGTPGTEWLMPWLIEKGVKPHIARKLAANPIITPELALAARIELENSAASKKPDFKPAGLIVNILRNPLDQIKEGSWEAADRLLAPKVDRPRTFTSSRAEDLFQDVLPTSTASTPTPILPPPRPTPAPILVPAMSDEDRATQIQQTISQDELAALHKEACAEAPNDFARMSAAKANPRTSYAIHALILNRLREAVGVASLTQVS